MHTGSMLSPWGSPSWGCDPGGSKDTDVVRDISQQQQWRPVSYPAVTVCVRARVHAHSPKCPGAGLGGSVQPATPVSNYDLGHVTTFWPLLVLFLSWAAVPVFKIDISFPSENHNHICLSPDFHSPFFRDNQWWLHDHMCTFHGYLKGETHPGLRKTHSK